MLSICTELGDIKLTLNDKAAPVTVNHIKQLVNNNIYDNTSFYRADFVIQCGLYGSKNKNPYDNLPINETNHNDFISNTRGTMAVAHHDVPDNGNSEIFINIKDNKHLDKAYGGYCVFAQVIDNNDNWHTIDVIEAAIKGGRKTVKISKMTIE